ncbi:GntR family transcriptional regulator [Rhizobium sp. P32RR-XVIII]|uniref:GntR family transcriptional regulator n=1 Tax=Rhizobium sp. P32RR-XVIII TaxID=2726738 RepID=UPI0028ABA91D|nr:GntR family transcriptional regulator [Rhizobium sp. P32RR-XVIII]
MSLLDAKDLEQIFAIRLALEKLALERAIGLMTESDHGLLRSMLLRMDHCETLKEWLSINEDFHGHINAACGWPRLVSQIERERSNIERYIRHRIRLDGRDEPRKEHWALLDACIARDVTKACSVLEKHLSTTARRIVEEHNENQI